MYFGAQLIGAQLISELYAIVTLLWMCCRVGSELSVPEERRPRSHCSAVQALGRLSASPDAQAREPHQVCCVVLMSMLASVTDFHTD